MPVNSEKSRTLRLAEDYHDDAVRLRRWFHEHPESSFREYETSKKIREELDRLNIPHAAVGETGVVATLEGRPGPRVVGLRADIDALEIEEKNEVDYRSQNPGLMHACGHDSHISSLLTAARILRERRDDWQGRVKLIFQPAEEIGHGAEQIVRSGLIDDAAAFFGIHAAPNLPAGRVSVVEGPIMAGSNFLKVAVTGKSGHAARPNEAIDAVVAGSAIVLALQQVVAREANPVEPAVVTVGMFHAGTRGNIIANRAELAGTLRVVTEESRERLSQAVKRIVRNTAAAYRVGAEVVCEYATPIVINSEQLVGLVRQAVRSLFSDEAVARLPTNMGTDDFAVYSRLAPAFYAQVGVGFPQDVPNARPVYPLHNEHFDIDERSLDVAASLFAEFARLYLNSDSGS